MSNVSKPELRVICAGGFRAAMERMLPDLEADIGAKLILTFGTPARTRELVTAGQGFDVAVVTVVSVDEGAASQLVEDPRFVVARSLVGMGFHPSRRVRPVGTLPELIEAIRSVETVGLSDPAVGTNLGADLISASERLGFAEALKPRARFFMGPGSMVSGEVARGAFDAVITLASEIVTVAGVAYAGPIPDDIGIDFPFLAGMARSTPHRGLAAAFLAFLRDVGARKAMEATGLQVLTMT